MQVNREFSPDVAQALLEVDEQELKAFLRQGKTLKNGKKKTDAKKLEDAIAVLKAANPFAEITDPVEWQRKQRKDRDLSR